MPKMVSTKSSYLKLPLITRIKLYIIAIANYFSVRRDGSLNPRVVRFVDMKAPAPATKRMNPTTTVSTSDITFDKSNNLWFRLFVPNNSGTNDDDKSLPLVVYFHGGGFTTLGPDSKPFDDLCCNIAVQANTVVASVKYRLSPEHRYPSQYEDGFNTLKFIDQHADTVLPSNTDTSKCFVAGDSSGGNIAHHVTLRFCKKSNEFKKIKIAGLVGIQPFFGGEERKESELRDSPSIGIKCMLNVKVSDGIWRSFLPEGADRNHPAGHVFRSAEDVKSVEFPRSLIIVGGYDPLLDWQKMYVEWLIRDCGKQIELIEYPNAFHGFFYFPELPEHGFLINDAAKFIQEQARS